MNDKDRDMIQQILKTAGETGQQGFAYMVHYRFIEGLTDVIGAVICASLCLFVIRWLWKEIDDDQDFTRFMMACICSFGFFFFLWWALSGVTSMLAPQGAAIHSMLKDIGASK